MSIIWLICLIPLIVPWIGKLIFKTSITFLEMFAQIVITVLIVVVIWHTGRLSQAVDTEIINGEITGKKSVQVSCSHSYSCNCRTECSGSGKNKSCSTVCDTCYEHNFDVDWRVYTNLFNERSFNIARVDRQGVKEPNRWTQVKKGQSASSEHTYMNYIKAVPNSIFNLTVDNEKFKNIIPNYPQVYDYHKINRIINIGINIKDKHLWNEDLSEILKIIGPKKQANIIIIMVKTNDKTFRHAVENAWLKGKKNDIVVFLGSEDGINITWTDVMSWAKHDIFNVRLREALYDVKTFDRNKIMDTIYNITNEEFVRTPMKEYEYLKDEIEPPVWIQILTLIASIVLSIVGTFLCHKHDFFESRRRFRY